MVTQQGFTYSALGYKTLEGEIPAYKVLDHLYVGELIAKHKPKPKRNLVPTKAGGKSNGKKRG